MRDSLQRPGSCREGALGLIHVRFSASTLSRLRFPAPRGLSRANCDVMHQHAVPRVARTSHTAITDGVEDLAKVLIDASILLRASGLTLLARRLLVGYFSARDFMFGVLFLVAPMRFVSSATWFVQGLRAWLTLRPGSRPRRTARKLLQSAARFLFARPLLARFLGPLLTSLPGLKRRIFFHFPAHPALASTVNAVPPFGVLWSERERFVHARLKAALGKRPS